MEHRIVGTTMPVLEMTLGNGESIVAEAGELSWISSSIELKTGTQAAGGGGLFGAFKRSVSGGTFFMTEYTARGTDGLVAFATKMPGHIMKVDVQPGTQYIIHRTGFLCGTPGVELSMAFQRSLGAGIFGGNGFIMQRLGGTAEAWVELDGEVVDYTLRPGETLRVHPGHVGMLEASVQFDVTRISGIKNMLFAGDGLFLAALTGPGKVWLQSLPLANLAHALGPYLPTQEASGDNMAAGVAGGVAGSIIKGIFGGNG